MDTPLKFSSTARCCALGRARRAFLISVSLLVIMPLPAPAAESGSGNQPTESRGVCVALGAGGANGLAHIPLLEVLDQQGIRPRALSGSSVGAIIGSLYASGMTGREIRRLVLDYFVMPEEDLVERLVSGEALRWMDFIEIDLGAGGLLGSEQFMAFLYKRLESKRFEDLEIPIRIVAADLWSREQVVFESGDLLPAIKASMALPGVFKPVVDGERVLIDGGTVNPVPWDLLPADCGLTVGIDVSGTRSRPQSGDTSYFEVVFNAVKVMQQAIVQEMRRHQEPGIFLAPEIADVRALEFYRAEEVFKQTEPAAREFRRRLADMTVE